MRQTVARCQTRRVKYIDKWRGKENCSTCCKCLDDHHDLFEYDKNDPNNNDNSKTYDKKEKYLSSKYYVVFNMKLVWQNIHLFMRSLVDGKLFLLSASSILLFLSCSLSSLVISFRFSSNIVHTHNTWYSFVPSEKTGKRSAESVTERGRRLCIVCDREKKREKRVQA